MVELIAVFADRFGLHSGIFGWVSSLDLNYVGYAIVGLFVVTWAVALAVWHFGRIEEKWSSDLAGRRRGLAVRDAVSTFGHLPAHARMWWAGSSISGPREKVAPCHHRDHLRWYLPGLPSALQSPP